MPESLHYDSLPRSLCEAANHRHPSYQVSLISEAVENDNVKPSWPNHVKATLHMLKTCGDLVEDLSQKKLANKKRQGSKLMK